MKGLGWLKKLFGKRKGTHTPYMGSTAHFTELEIDEVAKNVDRIHHVIIEALRSDGEPSVSETDRLMTEARRRCVNPVIDEPNTPENRVELLAMQMSESLGRQVSELEILDIEKRLARVAIDFPQMNPEAQWRAQVGPRFRLSIHSDARTVWPGVLGEVIVKAERFSQSWFEMLLQLKQYSVDELEQKIPMPGTIVTYGTCIKRTIEELQDELRQLDGLLAEMPRESKESS